MNFIKSIYGNPTLPFKIEIRIVYTVVNVCVKIQSLMAAKLNCTIEKL